jgi:acyl-CoA synthetase (AMP-forming)/AMP-acid ligase II
VPVDDPDAGGSRSDDPSSLAEILADEARRFPHRILFTELGRDGKVARTLTASQLHEQSRQLAGALARIGQPGDRVLVPAMTGLRFHVAFLGCLYAGLVAVPVPPIRVGGLRQDSSSGARRLGRLFAICEDATPVAAVVSEDQLDELTALAQQHEPLRRVAMVSARAAGDPLPVPVPVTAATIAFLQYTSGSTSSPKGVVVTNAAMLANQRVIQEKLDVRRDSTPVSWLPLYHDMGLCSGLLQPLYAGSPAVVMEPEAFLVRPQRWLEALSGLPDAISAAPDFAYQLTAARIPADVRATLDLTGWRVALCGAEPVRPQTLRRFADTFGECGFRSRALTPAYGLAESTLFVSGGSADDEPFVGRYDLDALGGGVARRSSGSRAVELVGAGSADDPVEVLIVDPESRQPCPPGQVGELWISSPSNGTGYWGRGEESIATFEAELTTQPGRHWLRSGDLGFRDGREIVVTGRLKDLIIIRGVNYYPQDFERLAQDAHPVLGTGLAAAFVDEANPEKVVVILEAERQAAGADLVAAAGCGARAILGELPVMIEVVLVDHARVPRTTSGKVRRQECARLYAEGRLAALARWPHHD